VPQQGSKLRRLNFRIAESTLDETLKHDPEIPAILGDFTSFSVLVWW
jgi:hypothetical protein